MANKADNVLAITLRRQGVEMIVLVATVINKPVPLQAVQVRYTNNI